MLLHTAFKFGSLNDRNFGVIFKYLHFSKYCRSNFHLKCLNDNLSNRPLSDKGILYKVFKAWKYVGGSVSVLSNQRYMIHSAISWVIFYYDKIHGNQFSLLPHVRLIILKFSYVTKVIGHSVHFHKHATILIFIDHVFNFFYVSIQS